MKFAIDLSDFLIIPGRLDKTGKTQFPSETKTAVEYLTIEYIRVQ